MDCSPPRSSVHGILQARIPEWVAISFSRECSRPRDWTQVSLIAGRRFNFWATWEAQMKGSQTQKATKYSFYDVLEKGKQQVQSTDQWLLESGGE